MLTLAQDVALNAALAISVVYASRSGAQWAGLGEQMRKGISVAILTAGILAGVGQLPAMGVAGEVVSMRRLTEQEYRNSIGDIFGKDIVVQGVFEPGKRIGGLIEASAALLSVTPVGFDSYSKMADSIAVQATSEKARDRLKARFGQPA
jgi:hypothetical protein